MKARFGVGEVATPLFDFAAGEVIGGRGARGNLTAIVASMMLNAKMAIMSISMKYRKKANKRLSASFGGRPTYLKHRSIHKATQSTTVDDSLT